MGVAVSAVAISGASFVVGAFVLVSTCVVVGVAVSAVAISGATSAVVLLLDASTSTPDSAPLPPALEELFAPTAVPKTIMPPVAAASLRTSPIASFFCSWVKLGSDFISST